MADERKAGAGTWSRDRKSTPALGLPSPESTAKSVRRLRANIARTGELCGSVERLVLEGGYDARSRAVMEDLADHFDALANIAAGTARALRRLTKP
jgi:hypothetical protein